jgi:hypothetical protein
MIDMLTHRRDVDRVRKHKASLYSPPPPPFVAPLPTSATPLNDKINGNGRRGKIIEDVHAFLQSSYFGSSHTLPQAASSYFTKRRKPRREGWIVAIESVCIREWRGGGGWRLEPKKRYKNKVRASSNIFSPRGREAIFALKGNGKGRHCIQRNDVSFRSKMRRKKIFKMSANFKQYNV